MFGENEIIGKETIKLDSKRKFRLPKFSGAELGDKLVIIKRSNNFMIYKTEDYLKVLNHFESQLKTEENFGKRVELRKKIRALYHAIAREVECDKNRQILLPMKFDGDEFECSGQHKHLVLKPLNSEEV